MNIQWMDLKQDAIGQARITLVVDVPPTELSETFRKFKEGNPYTVSIKPYRSSKTRDQNSCIWGKINDIASALCANKEDIYEECLRRYGVSTALRVSQDQIADLEHMYRLVDVKQRRQEDNTAFVLCYKGLSTMDSVEASKLLEGILDECREIGISAEVHDA